MTQFELIEQMCSSRSILPQGRQDFATADDNGDHGAAKRVGVSLSISNRLVRFTIVIRGIPDAAFQRDQSYCLAKLMGGYTTCSSVALMIADGITTSREDVIEELERCLLNESFCELDNSEKDDGEDYEDTILES